MKPRHTTPIITALALALQQCASQKESPFTYPSTMNAETNTDLRGDFVEQFHRGEVLYDLNCGGCHDITVGRKKVTPDFSVPQLLDYEMRTQYPSHGERLHEAKVSKEELDDIQVFLQYRKPSGHPITPPPVQHAPKVN